MPELRTDWLTGRSVFVAENRAARPNEFVSEVERSGAAAAVDAELALSRRAADCPFCRGQEHRTPPAVYESLDSGGRWQVRVVPNRFPAVTLQDEAVDSGLQGAAHSLSRSLTGTGRGNVRPAHGVHEVIVESARHVDRMSALSADELRGVLQAYAARLRHWRDDGRFVYGLVFKNQGPRAGASLAHVHSQLIALPDVPTRVSGEIERAERDYVERQSCPYCRLIGEERSARDRIVHEGEAFVAFCPFASLQPYEVWLLPTVHSASFEDLPSEELGDLAQTLHCVIARLETVVPDAAYNALLRTMPWRGDAAWSAWSHWRIELLPRTTALAGLEIGAGVFINPVAPERAAGKLRLA